MEKLSLSPKLLFIILGVLLVAGAVAAAVSLNGATLLSANPVQAQPAVEEPVLVQPPAEALEQEQVVPATGPTGPGLDGNALDEPYYQSEDGYGEGCGHDTQMNPEDL